MKRMTIADAGTVALVVCAVLVTGMVAWREFSSRAEAAPAPFYRSVDAGEALARTGQVLGPADAPVRIVEFSDFECQYCARVKKDLKQLRETFPGQIAVVYRHFPIDGIHPHARAAAGAAECAGEQGRFQQYHDALYADQHAIGLRSWAAFAEIADVPDLSQFSTCVAEERYAERIERDVRAGTELGVGATPTFVIGGQMFSGSVSPAEWERLVRRALAGE